MPDGLGGFELSVQLKKERPDLPVIFASGYSPEIAGHPETFRDGENFLSKPFDLKRLLATLSAALRRDPGSA
jgi:FixJ family two-component response regulator